MRHKFSDDEGARNEAMWDWISEQMPEEPYWFLDHVGVDPDQQGRGIGGALVRMGLEWSGSDAYLHSWRRRERATCRSTSISGSASRR